MALFFRSNFLMVLNSWSLSRGEANEDRHALGVISMLLISHLSLIKMGDGLSQPLSLFLPSPGSAGGYSAPALTFSSCQCSSSLSWADPCWKNGDVDVTMHWKMLRATGQSPSTPCSHSPPALTETHRASACFCTIVYTNSTKVKLHQEGLRKQHRTTMALMNAEFYNQEITML